LYRLPMIDGFNDTDPDATLLHKFSHLQWDIRAYIVDGLPSIKQNYFYVSIQDLLDAYPLVTAHKKILKTLNII
ncbi:MAG: A/G-specific adenine glycosylase, partial [Erysipelothrix sp.]|nr:A/G-specific adenine glycosylase [Erysipelothrix sp.]